MSCLFSGIWYIVMRFFFFFFLCVCVCVVFFCQAEDGIRDLVRSRGLGDVYKRQLGGGFGPPPSALTVIRPAGGRLIAPLCAPLPASATGAPPAAGTAAIVSACAVQLLSLIHI